MAIIASIRMDIEFQYGCSTWAKHFPMRRPIRKTLRIAISRKQFFASTPACLFVTQEIMIRNEFLTIAVVHAVNILFCCICSMCLCLTSSNRKFPSNIKSSTTFTLNSGTAKSAVQFPTVHPLASLPVCTSFSPRFPCVKHVHQTTVHILPVPTPYS